MQKKIINGHEVEITFDGEFYVGCYGDIQIKRFYKIDLVNWFSRYFRTQTKQNDLKEVY